MFMNGKRVLQSLRVPVCVKLKGVPNESLLNQSNF